MNMGSGDSFGDDLEGARDDFANGEREPRRARRRRSPSRKSFVSGRTAIVFGVIVTAVLLLALPMREYFRQNADINYSKAEAAKLQESVNRLQEQVNRWNDETYVRDQARERLNFVMPQEKAYVVLGSEQAKSDPEKRADRENKKQAWYDELWGSVSEADVTGTGPQPDAEFPHIVR